MSASYQRKLINAFLIVLHRHCGSPLNSTDTLYLKGCLASAIVQRNKEGDESLEAMKKGSPPLDRLNGEIADWELWMMQETDSALIAPYRDRLIQALKVADEAIVRSILKGVNDQRLESLTESSGEHC